MNFVDTTTGIRLAPPPGATPAEDLGQRLEQLNLVGASLSGERDLDRLLELREAAREWVIPLLELCSYVEERMGEPALWRALAYPLAILAGLALVLMLIGIHVLPKFEELYSDFRLNLPGVTKLLIELGHATPTLAAIAPLAPRFGTCASASDPASNVIAVCVIVAAKPPAM